jgi:serine phosphatase RsbU (regulator of sigma subunit)/uncharacterized protein YprB with RNaseH-like and TPR domain
MKITVDKFARLSALKPARTVVPRDTTLRPTDDTDLVGRLLGAGVARNDFGEHLAIRNWYSTPEFCAPSESALDLLSRTTGPAGTKAARSNRRLFPHHHYRDESATLRTRAALENPEKWLFLDTETTGLSGGTGTYAFLVGLAWWDAGGLQVEQLFLRDFSEEISLLHELSLRIVERPVLVTFNGKTFDWPLLQSRFTMTRKIAVPKLAAHLDLLHPARALWKLRLNSVRLVELEHHVLNPDRLGWHREDDIASSQIPQYYFDYLRGGRPDPLAGVAKHNAMDLRGLAALYGKIDGLLDERESNLAETNSLDLFGLSRFMNRRGEKKRAHSLCTRALDAGLPSTFRRQATAELAMMAKIRGDWEAAVVLWKELACNPRDGIAACEQLPMYYERRGKDCAQALEYANLGLAKAGQAKWLCRERFTAGRMEQWEQKFRRRLERLQNRMTLRKSARRLPLPDSTGATGSLEQQSSRQLPSPVQKAREFGGANRMDSLGTKRQAISEETMATAEHSYFQTELEQRRQHLLSATRANAADASLRQLLSSVDEALARLHHGTFGICEQCHDTIEADRLLCNPLLRFCIDHLSQDEQRALEHDLTLAAKIQRALLPRSDWAVDGWQARYHYQPAGLVSGDYCDLIETDDGFLFLLGDVAGKGVAASMLMSHLHATFRTLAGQKLPLQKLVEHANRLFCESTMAGQYATLVVGRVTSDGKVEYVSAGHLPLLHISPAGVASREATGVPLGMFGASNFPVCTLEVAPGDSLFLYTDGLTEIFNSAGDEFGIRRAELLMARHSAGELESILSACLSEIANFSAGVKRTDDLTLLALRRSQ